MPKFDEQVNGNSAWDPQESPISISAGDYNPKSNSLVNRFKRETSKAPQNPLYRVIDGNSIEQSLYTTPYDALWLVLVQVLAVVLCYHSSKFACKV